MLKNGWYSEQARIIGACSSEEITSSYVCFFSGASYACALPFCASSFFFRLA